LAAAGCSELPASNGAALASRPQRGMASLPWVERYRPRSVKDVSHQEEVIATLQKAVSNGAKKGDLPHLLLYGPPGTGKTSAALALCRDLYGQGEGYRNRVLELNASDERGIKVVRDKIKGFAQRTVSAAPPTGTPPPPFKVIVLDEADAITADAQTALRRTMEAHSKSTRFILICNYVSRIIAPLASRCAKFRFKPLPADAMHARLRQVASGESVKVEDSTLYDLVDTSGGDLRKAITTLQSAHRIARPGVALSTADVAAAACLVPTGVLNDFDAATADPSVTHKALREKVDQLVRDGYAASELLARYAGRIAEAGGPGVASLNKFQKAAIALAVADADFNLVEGGDELLQMYALISKIATATRHGNDRQLLQGFVS
jgi:replication factor C subunit 2/4